jgi:hypothetical protein
MSPELGVILLVTLLCGPTSLWLVYRALSGSDGFWVCDTCHSLNRSEANRCYGCRTAKDSPGRQAPDELPVGPGVPVMLPVSRGFPVMAEGIARSSGQLPVSRGFPVMAEGIARSSGAATGTTVAIATPRNAPPAPETVVPAPGHLLSAALLEAPAGVPVCPFLGWRDDPSTRYDYPDPANLCHATSERGATSVASPRRILTGVAGTRRSSPIGLGHQESHCLTAAHEQCARYPAVEVVAANR